MRSYFIVPVFWCGGVRGLSELDRGLWELDHLVESQSISEGRKLRENGVCSREILFAGALSLVPALQQRTVCLVHASGFVSMSSRRRSGRAVRRKRRTWGHVWRKARSTIDPMSF
jgi:hypothetical protein